jgi:mevalonate kinase
VKASAPGKIILFGEHAVVYGRPALAVPVTQVHADVEIVPSQDGRVWIDAPGVSLRSTLESLPSDHPIASIIHNLFFGLGISPFPPLEIRITSSIPVASGLGSGAAVTVAILRALSAYLEHPLSDEQVNQFAYEIEKLHHGIPSGIDNTVVTYAQPVYFVRGQPIQTFRVGAPFTLVVADTGKPAPTKESVSDVRKLWEADKPGWEKVFDEIGAIADQARDAIESGKTKELGRLMDSNHALLQRLTVSSTELDHLTEIARKSGANGAKLSGGGRGGNLIALVDKEKAPRVAKSLLDAGAKRTIITEIKQDFPPDNI